MTFINPNQLLALAVSFMDVTIVLLLLRAVTVRMTRRKWHADDVVLGVAGVFTVAICINMITAAAYEAWGKSLPITTEKGKPLALAIFSAPLQQNGQFLWAQQLMFLFQITFARLSIVLFYRRTLVPEPFGVLHWATVSVSGILGAWLVSFFFAYLFECGSQPSLIWSGPALTQAKSCAGNSLELSQSITGVLLDLTIVFLPLHRILTLGLSPSKKIQVASAFMVGFLSVAGGTVRLAALISANLKVKNVFTTLDPAMLNSNMAYWQVFEVGFAMMAASLPGLRPLINRVAGVLDSTFSSMVSRPEKEKTLQDGSAGSFDSTGKIVKTPSGLEVQMSKV